MVPVGDQKQSLIVSFALVLMMSGFEKSKHLIRAFKNASRKKKAKQLETPQCSDHLFYSLHGLKFKRNTH